MSRHFARGAPIPGVECRLPAAGLVFRKLHSHSQMLQHLDSGARDIIVERVAQTGAHEEHPLGDGPDG